MKKNLFYALLSAMILFTACSKDDETNNPEPEETFFGYYTGDTDFSEGKFNGTVGFQFNSDSTFRAWMLNEQILDTSSAVKYYGSYSINEGIITGAMIYDQEVDPYWNFELEIKQDGLITGFYVDKLYELSKTDSTFYIEMRKVLE